MKQKSLLRLIVFVLISSLIADPRMAFALATPPLELHVSTHENIFTYEALTDAPVAAPLQPLAGGIKDRLSRWTAVQRFVVVADSARSIRIKLNDKLQDIVYRGKVDH